MAFSKITKDMNIIAALDDEPNDVGGLSAAQLKAKFDEGGLALKTFINNLIDAIAAGTAAANIGAEDLNGVATDLQTALDNLAGAVIGTLPDGSVTTAKLYDGAVTTAKIADEAVTDAKVDWATSKIGRMEVVTYVGTNTYGPDHPCSVTFAQKPKLIFIFNGVSGNYNQIAIVNISAVTSGSKFVRVGDTSNAYANHISLTNDGKTVTWYADDTGNTTASVQLQMNETGTHYVFALY